MTTLTGVFVAALVAATIVPFYSEIAVGAAVLMGHPPASVWLAATAGNTLGAVVNGVLGRVLGQLKIEQWLGVSPRQTERARSWFQRWGAWSLLLAWLPVGGDALTVIAGMMRVGWGKFVALVMIGKGARYAALIWLLS